MPVARMAGTLGSRTGGVRSAVGTMPTCLTSVVRPVGGMAPILLGGVKAAGDRRCPAGRR